MRLLLDTQVVVRYIEDESLLTQNAREAIRTANEVYVTPVNFYEIAIKLAIGKDPGVSSSVADIIAIALRSGFIWLPLSASHIEAYTRLPFFEQHRDPFDRMILAIALADGLTIISTDRHFSLYQNSINVLW